MGSKTSRLKQVVASVVSAAKRARDTIKFKRRRRRNCHQLKKLWQPKHPHRLPTKEEMVKTGKAILALECMLTKELASLTASQVANMEATPWVKELRGEIELRKAWIAPIRKLHFDILAVVFVWSNEVDWISNMRIAAVSRLWRETIMATPEAWTVFDLLNERRQALRELYMERSRLFPLHLSRRATPGSEFRSQVGKTTLPSLVTDRIHCALFGLSTTMPSATTFPHLVFLSLGGITLLSDQRLFPLTRIQMPVLRNVRVAGAVSVDRTRLKTEEERQEWRLGLPSVENLSVPNLDGSWTETFAGLSNTLTSLELRSATQAINSPKILLPALRHLRITGAYMISSDFTSRLDLETPALVSYFQKSEMSQLFHHDIASVTHLRLENGGYKKNAVVGLPRCPRLQVFQVGIIDREVLLETMFRDPASHPDLVDIQFTWLWASLPRVGGLRFRKQRTNTHDHLAPLNELNQARKRPVRLWFTKEWEGDFPSEHENSCGEHLPCHRPL